MHFQNPWLLWLLLVLPPLVALLIRVSFQRQKQFRELYGSTKLLSKHSRLPSKRLQLTRVALAALGVSMLVVALSRPSIDSGSVEFPQGSTDVIVIVDVSRSMAALDYKGKMPKGTAFDHGTRLDMARELTRNRVVPALGANRLGIVTYAGQAFPLAFLTQDVSAVDWVHKRAVTISSAPGEGSHMARAFKMAFRLFDLDSPQGNKRLIILFSDGGNDDKETDLSAAILEMRERGIDLVVIGLGKTTQSPIPIAELPPGERFQMGGGEYYMENGEIALTALDENLLRLVANRAGGKYVRIAQADDFSFDSLSRHLDMKYRRGQKELFTYPLLLALFSLLGATFIGEEYTGSTVKRVRRWLRQRYFR